MYVRCWVGGLGNGEVMVRFTCPLHRTVAGKVVPRPAREADIGRPRLPLANRRSCLIRLSRQKFFPVLDLRFLNASVYEKKRAS